MNEYINDVRKSILCKNWYSALMVALTLPDICGHLEYPELGSQKRYVNWFNKYMLDKYSFKVKVDRTPHVFLSGEDCYALRCALLHEGDIDITEQRARKALDSFQFVEPKEGLFIHCNQSNTVLQLQVDIFCEDICKSIEKWIDDIKLNKSEIYEKFNTLLKIKSLDNGFIL